MSGNLYQTHILKNLLIVSVDSRQGSVASFHAKSQETTHLINGEFRSYWFDLPIDIAKFEELLGVGAESRDYRIIEKVLPFASFHAKSHAYDVASLKCKYSRSLPAYLKIYLSSNHSNLKFKYQKSSQS